MMKMTTTRITSLNFKILFLLKAKTIISPKIMMTLKNNNFNFKIKMATTLKNSTTNLKTNR